MKLKDIRCTSLSYMLFNKLPETQIDESKLINNFGTCKKVILLIDFFLFLPVLIHRYHLKSRSGHTTHTGQTLSMTSKRTITSRIVPYNILWCMPRIQK